jgi:hypothetical protein
VTVTLSPATEAKVIERAHREGQEVNAFVDALLDEILTEDPDDLTEDQVESIRNGVRTGLEAAAAGRERPLRDYSADVIRDRKTRNGQN